MHTMTVCTKSIDLVGSLFNKSLRQVGTRKPTIPAPPVVREVKAQLGDSVKLEMTYQGFERTPVLGIDANV